jgi:hydroxymethylpyrimidine/phosphomethylpyrimidine kinase
MLITPNTEEAARLCGFSVKDREGMQQAAACLHQLGADYVLIKGGHLEGKESCDLLFDGEDYNFRQWPRIDGPSPHGTGCVLAAAIAANLAHEQTMAQAVANAQDYLHNLRQHPLKIGKGYPLLSNTT